MLPNAHKNFRLGYLKQEVVFATAREKEREEEEEEILMDLRRMKRRERWIRENAEILAVLRAAREREL